MKWIDLNKDVLFTKAQLEKRAEALVRQKYPLHEELRILRMAAGNGIGKVTLLQDDQKEIDDYYNHVTVVHGEKKQAEVDNHLLASTIAYEQAKLRLKQPPIQEANPDLPDEIQIIDEQGKTTMVPNPVLIKDQEERQAAEHIINKADSKILALIDMRDRLKENIQDETTQHSLI